MIRFDSRPWAVLLVAGSILGCNEKSPVKPIDPIAERQLAPEIVADARSLVEANNRFAFDIYARLRSEPGNLFLSPYSISTAFSMAYAGAAGSTAQEMADVFHFPLPQDQLHPTFGALQRSLDRGVGFGGYELRVANRAWSQSGYALLPAFLEVTRDDYGAEMRQADFVSQGESARQEVNAWVEERTNRRIRDLFPRGSITADTRLVLANAIYFKGLWARQFERAKTQDAVFHLGPGEQIAVPTMNQEGQFRLGRSADAEILELPYRGRDLSMFILLPSRIDGLAELEASLTLDRLRELIAGTTETKVVVRIPRFQFASKFSLPEVLSAMGMPAAFGTLADFSGMNGRRDLFISSALHQAFVEVNEEGTEAAAATGIGVGVVSMPPSFHADHPFLFLIHDNVTESILFMGRVVDPRG